MSEPRLWMRLTHACNNRCVFCLDGDQNDPGSFIAFDELMGRLEEGRRRRMRRVVLSGGEPTLHPRFLDVVREAKAMGYGHVQVITNGRRFCYPRFLEDSVGAGLREATFSMHGHRPGLHDRLVGVKGAFAQSVAGLAGALRRSELIVSVDVVLNLQNIRVIDELLAFFVRMGVREFDLLHPVPFGRAWENWEELDYDPEAYDSLRRALSLSRRGVTIWTNRMPARYLEGFEDLIQPPEKIHDEVRGRAGLFEDFLQGGRMPDCHARDRCGHCFLAGFCSDLKALRRKKVLRGLPMPPCLPKSRGRRRGVFRWAGARTDLKKWAQFYIDRRFFVKGRACSGCRCDRKCSGAPIRFIRKEGFRALRPFPKRLPAGRRRG